MSEGCQQCEKDKSEGNPVKFKQKRARCKVCKKQVKQVLDLHHTGADLCSVKCERKFWLDIFN